MSTKGKDMVLHKLVISLLTCVSITSCTWVKLTPEGEKVRVLSVEEVSSCNKLGKTEVSLRDKVAGVKRSEEKVKLELETLARNSASNMNGDTVVPDSEIVDGKQTYVIYRCVKP
jgi:hypothetical protein